LALFAIVVVAMLWRRPNPNHELMLALLQYRLGAEQADTHDSRIATAIPT